MVEHTATSEYFIVPFDNEQMEWVQTSHGRVPAGKRPVGGAREGDSRGTLLHALAKLPGHEDKMVGKAGPYLQGALVPHDGTEPFAAEYEILSVGLKCGRGRWANGCLGAGVRLTISGSRKGLTGDTGRKLRLHAAKYRIDVHQYESRKAYDVI